MPHKRPTIIGITGSSTYYIQTSLDGEHWVEGYLFNATHFRLIPVPEDD